MAHVSLALFAGIGLFDWTVHTHTHRERERGEREWKRRRPGRLETIISE